MPSTGSGGNATDFRAQITSYDYSAPISEAGGTGQPGIGGANKFEVQRVTRMRPLGFLGFYRTHA